MGVYFLYSIKIHSTHKYIMQTKIVLVLSNKTQDPEKILKKN